MQLLHQSILRGHVYELIDQPSYKQEVSQINQIVFSQLFYVINEPSPVTC